MKRNGLPFQKFFEINILIMDTIIIVVTHSLLFLLGIPNYSHEVV